MKIFFLSTGTGGTLFTFFAFDSNTSSFTFGLDTFTVTVLPHTSLPLRASTAAVASSGVEKVTNANPLPGLKVSTTFPNSSKAAFISSSSVSCLTPCTNSLQPSIVLASALDSESSLEIFMRTTFPAISVLLRAATHSLAALDEERVRKQKPRPGFKKSVTSPNFSTFS